MGRRKIEICAIKNRKNRHNTFFKRKSGLFKKIKEIGTLCRCKTMAVVFFDGEIYETTNNCEDLSELFGEYTKIICVEEPLIPDAPKIEENHDFNRIMEYLWVSLLSMPYTLL